MKNIQVFQVDAFANKVFEGNPAAVVPLTEWLEDDILQKIASEFNLSETAFIVQNDKKFHLRWFTPKAEVQLCGHATLATAHILFTHLNYKGQAIKFETLSGELMVKKGTNNDYEMSLPCDTAAPTEIEAIQKALSEKVLECYKGKDDFMAILESEVAVKNANPDLAVIKNFESRGLVITANGDTKDFVSRCFYPQLGIDEDPATGSAHTLLTPYWAVKLNKNHLEATQLSSRGAEISCSLSSESIILRGKAITVLEGHLSY